MAACRPSKFKWMGRLVCIKDDEYGLPIRASNVMAIYLSMCWQHAVSNSQLLQAAATAASCLCTPITACDLQPEDRLLNLTLGFTAAMLKYIVGGALVDISTS